MGAKRVSEHLLFCSGRIGEAKHKGPRIAWALSQNCRCGFELATNGRQRSRQEIGSKEENNGTQARSKAGRTFSATTISVMTISNHQSAMTESMMNAVGEMKNGMDGQCS
jgi:hypothetical protein